MYLNGEKIFDRKENNNALPDPPKVLELKMTIGDKIFELDEAASNA